MSDINGHGSVRSYNVSIPAHVVVREDGGVVIEFYLGDLPIDVQTDTEAPYSDTEVEIDGAKIHDALRGFPQAAATLLLPPMGN